MLLREERLCPWCAEHPVANNHLFCRACTDHEDALIPLVARHRDTYQHILTRNATQP